MAWFGLAMFAVACLVLMAGYPVAFTLAGVALLFTIIGVSIGSFDLNFIENIASRLYGIMENEILLAVPLFVFMGVMLEKSKIAEDLLETMAKLFGSMRGGLGISVVIVGALLAASTGIVGATVVTMGLLSLPTMRRNGYDDRIASGVITASGTLGQIIPPSITLILLGDVISAAYQDAQRSLGNFAPQPVSVGDLFAGALLPGLMLVSLYILWVIFLAIFRGKQVPALPVDEGQTFWSLIPQVLKALVPPLLLILAVLGSILGGIATATEAAGVGAMGALVLAIIRAKATAAVTVVFITVAAIVGWLTFNEPLWAALQTVGNGQLVGSGICWANEQYCVPDLATFTGLGVVLFMLTGTLFASYFSGLLSTLGQVGQQTLRTSSMVFAILIGASLFSLVFRAFGGDELVAEFLTSLPGGVVGAMIVVMLVMFVLGFVLDFIEITFVVVPIVGPVLLAMDVNPVWLGVMMAMNLQTSFLTPPFGFALFFLRGVAPADLKTTSIYRGVIPFICIQIFALLILAYWPQLATWLPNQIYGQ